MSLISAIIDYILGSCSFLSRHLLKSFFIDSSSNPHLRFNNNSKKLVLKVCDTSSLERSLEQTIYDEMQPEMKMYGPQDLNPYNNPWLILKDNTHAAETLNSCKSLYLKSKEKYLRNTYNSEIIQHRWLPIDLYIVNTGGIATKSMTIIIKGAKNLYPNSKVVSNSGICYKPPTGAERFNSNIVAGADIYLKKFEYQYLSVSDQPLIQVNLKYELSNPIRQGRDNRYKLDTLYIDASKPMEIQLEWNIYEDTLGKRGNRGTLKINCIP